jgi:hypothetical protein
MNKIVISGLASVLMISTAIASPGGTIDGVRYTFEELTEMGCMIATD